MVMIFELSLNDKSHRNIVLISELFIMALDIRLDIFNLLQILGRIVGFLFDLQIKGLMVHYSVRVYAYVLMVIFIAVLMEIFVLLFMRIFGICDLRFVVGIETPEVFMSSDYSSSGIVFDVGKSAYLKNWCSLYVGYVVAHSYSFVLL